MARFRAIKKQRGGARIMGIKIKVKRPKKKKWYNPFSWFRKEISTGKDT